MGITFSEWSRGARFSHIHSLNKQVYSASFVSGAAESSGVLSLQFSGFSSYTIRLLGLYTLKQHCMEVEYLDRVRMEDGISVYLILLTCEAGILSIFGEETKLGLFLPKSPLLPVST